MNLSGLILLVTLAVGLGPEANGDLEETLAGRIALAEAAAPAREKANPPKRSKKESRERREDVEKIHAALSTLADRLRGDSAIEDDLRGFLLLESFAELIFDTWIKKRHEMHPVKLILDHTPLGRALHRAGDGAWQVNRHAVWELDDLLQRLGRLAGDPEDDGAETPLERIPAIEREIAAEGARSVVDLGKLAYTTDAVDLLRSSIFYNPRTRAGAWFYGNEIEDHHTARLFGLWGWNAKVSKDEADLLKRLRDRQPGLAALAKTHDKLIIHISGMPPWLSSSDDTGTFEGGGWLNKQTHPPEDMRVWRRLIRELARVFKSIKGVERYYEFWNEPDLKYWQGGLDEFLALYAETAKVIRKTDPQGKIGGCAVNQWDGRIHKKATSDPLNFELIRYAGANKLPLDFVSWHHFGRPVAAIAQAKAAYESELGKAGFGKMPEFLVTEWSSAGRGMPYANIPFAETMLGFFEAKLHAQTASCLEEFHPKPDPKGFAPWGLITQQGQRKNTWFVHRFLDRLARGSLGVAVVRPDDRRTLVFSRKAGGVYDILVWERGTPARLKAAWESLQESGYTSKEAARAFRIGDRMERAISAGEPPDEKWRKAFEAAKEVYDAHPVQTPRLVLELTGAKSVEVLEAEAVRMGLRPRRAVALGNTLSAPLAPQEVLRLRVRVK